ncbi:acyltransferase domain-containing protein [Streptomyces tateyamensis]|uniref:acyltransferase domain-containing protein n=1 Tax=Streptomyces tateyamensis TaxID=565073 RepID=UPI0011B6FEF6|nr:acyltransferase domain-containing protein [Streptomyces tateyamensis]
MRSAPSSPVFAGSVVHLFSGQGDFALTPLLRLLPRVPSLAAAVAEVFAQADRAAAEFGVAPLGPRLLGSSPPSAGALAGEPPGAVQLALFGVSLAVHRALEADGCRADRLVAVSFGEIPALTAAGCCSVADGARLAGRLGQLLTGHGGGMTLVGVGPAGTRALLDRAGPAADTVVPACVNHRDETVLSGPLDALAAVERFAARKGVSVQRLRLPFMSHHPALAREAGAFAHYARRLRLVPPRRPVFSVVAGRLYGPDNDLPRALSACLVRSFTLPAVLGAALPGGSLAVEAGTGRALANSVRLIDPRQRVCAPLAEGSWLGRCPRGGRVPDGRAPSRAQDSGCRRRPTDTAARRQL